MRISHIRPDIIRLYEKLLKAGYPDPAGYENLAFGTPLV